MQFFACVAAENVIVRFVGLELVICRSMDEIVHLGETSQCPSARVPIDLDGEFEADYVDGQGTLPHALVDKIDGPHGVGATNTPRSSCTLAESQAAPAYEVRGPNWTKGEMLVLIAQKRIEWNGRHSRHSQPSTAKFVYGSTTWK